MHEFRIKDLVKRARLNRSTTHYVVKSRVLHDTPEGSRGEHRVFSLSQAVWLSLAIILVEAGIPLRSAAKIVMYCQGRIDRLAKPVNGWPDDFRFKRVGSAHWKLTVEDNEVVRLWRDGLERAWDYEDCFQISTGTEVKDPTFMDPIRSTKINLSRLEQELSRN